MKNRVIILTAALLFAMSLSAHAQIGGILRQIADAVDGTGNNQTQPQQQPAANLSLDGIWEENGGNSRFITISGSAGTLSAISPSPSDRLAIDAVNKGYWSVGGTHWRSLRSTGNSTWSGEWSGPTYNSSNPGVAVGSRWVSDTWTLSSNGQTLTVGNADRYSTWTKRSSYPLDGIWEENGGNSRVITISGSTGTLSAISPSPSDRLAIDAVNKGYWAVGGTHWRSLRSTGNSTWSGEWSGPTYNSSNPGVAVGSRWVSDTWTLSSNGQTLTVGNADRYSTWTRKQ